MTPATVVRAFGRFWWEVLVGETLELVLGTVATVLVAWGWPTPPAPVWGCSRAR